MRWRIIRERSVSTRWMGFSGRTGPAGDAMLLLSRSGIELMGGRIEHADETTGTFRIGPLPAGEWSQVVVEANVTQHRHGPREVLPGETWDLGDVRLP